MISMRPTTVALALGLTLGLAGSRPALAQDEQKGAALMAEARKAIGGDDKLRAVKTLESKGTLKRTAGNNTQEADVEVLIELPGKYRRNELSGFAGGPTQERVEVLNGQDVWDINAAGGGFGRGGFGGGFGGGRRGDGGGGGRGFGGGQGQAGQPNPGQANPGQANQGGRAAQPIDPERLKELQRRQRQTELARLTLMWLLTTDAPVTWVGTAESPDGNADVLEVKAGEGPATRVFLDAATHMPLMLTTTAGGGRGQFGRRGGGPDAPASPQGAPTSTPPQAAPTGGAAAGQPITIETHLSEYKSVNGIKLPHLITRSINGQTNEEWEIKSFKINPNLKASTFTK